MARSSTKTGNGVLVVDRTGTVFNALHQLDLGTSLWCVGDASRITHVEDMDLAVYAGYGDLAWTDILALAARVRTMIVTTEEDRGDALHALSYGLIGYLSTKLSPDALQRALRSAMLGEPAYHRDAIGAWLEMQHGRGPASDGRGLTPRQLEVLGLVARGAADKEIGTALGISTATAQKHVTNILERLDVPNRAAAVATAFSPAGAWLHDSSSSSSH